MISSHNYFLDQSISQYWSISSVLCFLVVGYQWFCRQYVMEQYLMSSPSFDWAVFITCRLKRDATKKQPMLFLWERLISWLLLSYILVFWNTVPKWGFKRHCVLFDHPICLISMLYICIQNKISNQHILCTNFAQLFPGPTSLSCKTIKDMMKTY